MLLSGDRFTSVAIEDTEKVMILIREVGDVDTRILHVQSPT